MKHERFQSLRADRENKDLAIKELERVAQGLQERNDDLGLEREGESDSERLPEEAAFELRKVVEEVRRGS